MSCIVCLSKFYSSGDPLFLGHSPSPAFSTNELFLVPTGFGAVSRPMRCLQSNRTFALITGIDILANRTVLNTEN